jgi:hypothetical protein
MGGASTGGEDKDVSGAEAVYTGLTTYSSKKTKTVNQEIADTNQENRDDRKSPLAKIFSKTPLGSTLNKISNSKFVQDKNYKSRLKFALKSGKFKDTPLTRDFVLSKGFKTQLDGMGYSDEPGNVGGGGNDRPEDENQPLLNVSTQPVNNNVTTAPTNAEVTQAQSTEMSADQILLANKKKGRSTTILNSSQGLGSSTANTTKKTLGA